MFSGQGIGQQGNTPGYSKQRVTVLFSWIGAFTAKINEKSLPAIAERLSIPGTYI
jgi:hypothetical protein